MPLFLEMLFYDSGLQFELYPKIGRPKYLPPQESIGLRSTEAELQPGDYAIELSLFESDQSKISWIGCFTNAADRTLGNRGGSCGCGMWLVDEAPIATSSIINVLIKATNEIAKNFGPTDNLRRSFSELFPKLSERGCSLPLASLPNELWGPIFEKNGNRNSAYSSLPSSDEGAISLVAGDIRGVFFGSSANFQYNRYVYFLGSNRRLAVDPNHNIQETSADKKAADALLNLVSTNKNENIAINDLRSKYEKNVAKLEGENSKSVARANQLAQEHQNLLKQISQLQIENEKITNAFETVNKYIPNIKSIGRSPDNRVSRFIPDIEANGPIIDILERIENKIDRSYSARIYGPSNAPIPASTWSTWLWWTQFFLCGVLLFCIFVLAILILDIRVPFLNTEPKPTNVRSSTQPEKVIIKQPGTPWSAPDGASSTTKNLYGPQTAQPAPSGSDDENNGNLSSDTGQPMSAVKGQTSNSPAGTKARNVKGDIDTTGNPAVPRSSFKPHPNNSNIGQN